MQHIHIELGPKQMLLILARAFGYSYYFLELSTECSLKLGQVLDYCLVVSVIPDTYRLCTGKISGGEFGERTACNGAGAVGGTGGAWAGAAIGLCICPGIGTAIGGFIGGIAGGIGASAGVGRLFHKKKN